MRSDIWTDHRELVTPKARESVGWTQARSEANCDLAQHFVSHGMPVDVVDVLEAIQVTDQDADAGAWFLANGGLTRANGQRYRDTLLAPGGSVDVMSTYRAFRGQDPDITHLLARRGLN